MRSLYSLEAGLCVKDWRDLAAKPKLADAVIVSTQDKDHKESNYGVQHSRDQRYLMISIVKDSAITNVIQ